MKKLIMFVAAALLVTGLTGCVVKTSTKSKRISKTFAIQEFERINLSGNFDVVYSQGDKVSARAEGDERVVNSLELTCSDGTLNISQKRYSLKPVLFSGSTVLYVTSPDLTGIKMTGNGDFEAPGQVDTDELQVELTGNGDIDFERVICDKIFLTLTGNGDIDVKDVTAGAANIQLTGNGDVTVGGRVGKFDMKKMGNGDVDTSNLKMGESTSVESKGR